MRYVPEAQRQHTASARRGHYLDRGGAVFLRHWLLCLLAALLCGIETVVAGDFNGDGNDDVLLRNEDGRWFYYPMDGRRHIVSERGLADLTRNRDWRFAGIGDFNGDGKDDVLLRHEDGRWWYYPMDGRRHIVSQRGLADLTRNLAWQVAGIGDLNGDGKDDVLLRNEDGRWFYYPMDGRNHIVSLRGLADMTRNLAWQFAGIGDLNGDGKDDVLLRHEDGRWWYYPMDGRRHITSARGYADLTRNLAWQFAGIGDFNGDGKDDVLLRHEDGRWWYYPMNGRRHIVGERGLADLTPNTAWQLAGIGDLNGDGRDDVLVRNEDGRWFYYPMNGRRHIVSERGLADLTRNLAWSIAGGGSATPDLVVKLQPLEKYTLTGGETISVAVTVSNFGTARSSPTSVTYLLQEVDDEDNLSFRSTWSHPIGALAPADNGYDSTLLTAPAIPPWDPGDYNFFVCVEKVSNENITENNCVLAVITVIAPDLIVHSPMISFDGQQPDKTFTLKLTVENIGTARSSETELDVHRSDDIEISVHDDVIDVVNIGPLEPSESVVKSIDLGPNPASGYYGACVDPPYGESQPYNNCSQGSPLTRGALVRVESISASKRILSPDERFTLTAKVRNIGTERSEARSLTFKLTDYDSTENSNTHDIGEDSIDPLEPLSTVVKSIVLEAPSSPGNYEYSACVSTLPGSVSLETHCLEEEASIATLVSESIQESDEKPDLVIDSLSVSKDVLFTLEPITVSFTVRNIGNGPTQYDAQVYVMRTDLPNSNAYNLDGNLVYWYEYKDPDLEAGLEPSGISTISIDWFAPASDGIYEFSACVDAVFDFNEENNCSEVILVTVIFPDEVWLDELNANHCVGVRGKRFTFNNDTEHTDDDVDLVGYTMRNTCDKRILLFSFCTHGNRDDKLNMTRNININPPAYGWPRGGHIDVHAEEYISLFT